MDFFGIGRVDGGSEREGAEEEEEDGGVDGGSSNSTRSPESSTGRLLRGLRSSQLHTAHRAISPARPAPLDPPVGCLTAPQAALQAARPPRPLPFSPSLVPAHTPADDFFNRLDMLAEDPSRLQELQFAPPSHAECPSAPRWYDNKKHKWKTTDSHLQTRKCFRCNTTGHLPAHCPNPLKPLPFVLKRSKPPGSTLSLAQQSFLSRARNLRKSRKGHQCFTCAATTSLVHCLDCELPFCDSAGHIRAHLEACPRHTTVYSHKLGMMIKCHNLSCPVADYKKLLCCGDCLAASLRVFDCDVAAWKPRKSSQVLKAFACDEHFEWHRMNCPSALSSCEGDIFTADPGGLSRLHTHLF